MTDNELIAEFMGYKLKQGKQLAQYISGGHEWYWVGENFTIDEPSWLPESNWNLLMPVVEKTHIICDQMMRKYPENKDLDDATGWRAWSYRHPKLTTDITRVYNQVVEFIKWYNQNRKQ